MLVYHPHFYLNGKKSFQNARVPVSHLSMYLFQNFPITESVFNKLGDHLPIQEKSSAKSLVLVIKALCLATISHQNGGPTNLTAVILGCPLHGKSHFLKSHFHIIIIIIIIITYMHIENIL